MYIKNRVLTAHFYYQVTQVAIDAIMQISGSSYSVQILFVVGVGATISLMLDTVGHYMNSRSRGTAKEHKSLKLPKQSLLMEVDMVDGCRGVRAKAACV